MTIVSWQSHFLIPKKIALLCVLFYVGCKHRRHLDDSIWSFGGIYLSNRLYTKRAHEFLGSKTRAVKRDNSLLASQKDEYKALFSKLAWQLDESGSTGPQPKALSRDDVGGFHQLATTLHDGLKRMQDKLEEKEFELWVKEGLLEYQE